MKKIVLIGDSIRMGYESTVRQELAGAAEVWAPVDNCQHSVNVLLNFWTWVARQKPDILHINAGAWDVRNVLRGEPGNVVPLEPYRQNVARLLELGKRFAATVIWATITPMNIAHNFAHHAARGHPARTEGDIELYNAAAVAECEKAGVPVNDLYQFVLQNRPTEIRLPDGVHYSDAGYAVLGRHVAGVLRRHL